jgi:hypothetical protein
MLIDNEKHRKYHASGPVDCHWGETKDAVCSIQVTRSTIQNEQMTISVPVFIDDTRETLDIRLGMMMSLAQDRMDDALVAWQEAEERSSKTDRSEIIDAKKKQLAAVTNGSNQAPDNK